ncbi:fibronectin type III-like domain-contianing protein, partial [Stenotrophomonas maltophilia]
HGLSYTSFGYAGLAAPATVAPGAVAKVRVTIRNTGELAGKEVVQLYVARADRTPEEPIKQLAAFAKVALAPGE